MVRIPPIDRSFAATPRAHPRKPVTFRYRAPADVDVPTRGFARELSETGHETRGRETIEPRNAWRTSGPGRGRLFDIIA